jgi:predicted transcriptional regulator
MTVQLTTAQEQRLESIAAASNRTTDELAQEALDAYLQHIELLTAAVREGEDSAEREGWLTNDEVFGRLHERIRKTA